jgi:hypothetical protein
MPAQLQINQGPQDALLYDNSKSFFNPLTYQRTSNFQMELKDVTSNTSSQPTFGGTQRFVIPKAADLLGPVDLLVELNYDTFAAADLVTTSKLKASNAVDGTDESYNVFVGLVEAFGYAMIDTIEFKVGLSSVETITGDQLYIMNELYKDDDHRLSSNTVGKTSRPLVYYDPTGTSPTATIPEGSETRYDNGGRLIAHTNGESNNPITNYAPKRLIIPLNFFFTKGPGHYFPLAAIAGCNDIEVIVKFRSIKELLIAKTDHALASGIAKNNLTPLAVNDVSKKIKIGSSKLRCHYIHVTGPEATFLMNKEQVRLMQPWAHKDFIKKLKCKSSSHVAEKIQLDLPFMHPVKELIIVIRKVSEIASGWGTDARVVDQDQGSRTRNRFAFHGGNKDPNPESVRNSHSSTSAAEAASAYLEVLGFQVKLNSNSRHPDLEAWTSVPESGVNDQSSSMQLDRQYLMERLQPMYHTNSKAPYAQLQSSATESHQSSKNFAALSEMFDRKEIYCFPFSISPESTQPAGAVNFSKVHNATLEIQLIPKIQAGGPTDVDFQIDVYALHYNWLMIKDGAATMSFS